jgi:lytic cellulose monooxygenase (C1-hydroxylating)
MKSTFFALVAAFAAQKAAAHATFQDLWINGVDQGSTCVRLPPSNNPVTSVSSTDIRCNVGGTQGVSGKCAVKAGDTVTVEMHQQPGDRSCSTEAIGGDHFGPIHVYLSKVSDATTADGSSGWFKIYADTWSHGAGSTGGRTDNWGTVDMNNCCGHVDVKIPTDIPAGDYLLRAEVIALHVASSSGGAQFYMSCCKSFFFFQSFFSPQT